MNRNIFKSLFSVILLFSSQSAVSVDGNIEFIGEIIDQACEVKTDSKNIQVPLGSIPKANLPNVGSKSTPVLFTITLINCPVTVTRASVLFDAIPYPGDNTVLALKADTGVATGVGIQLTDKSNAIITLLTPSNSYTLLPNVDNPLNFTANYIAKARPVTPGPANGAATFLIVYN
ncbi:TPA: fimbrial protein [Providencia alcalifaciens]|uniref:fimbrial protein n=1 Tax=Providencia alcalifaciens TaxID=126385 RepID=UPI001CC4A7AE|nr:fimbrial protein [Providencia alcalifaciens]CAG9407798.1 S-fimbrial protein subunit SfaA [Providencia alcalifaciens]